MPDDISAKVAALPQLPTAKLKALWEDLFSKPAHAKIRRELMIPVLTYRLQEEAYGGLPKETLTRLHNLAKDIERNPRTVSLVNLIKPGTRLMRSWGGDSHEVTVISGGYSYRGKTYKSLSCVAREITGTRWSGPLFFGLKTKDTGKARG